MSPNDPTIHCPQCNTEIKLTESLAAPLVASTRKQFQEQLAKNNAEIAKKETVLFEKERELAKNTALLDEKITEQLQLERVKIIEDESKKAHLRVANEILQQTQQLTEMNKLLQERDAKLADAQKAQVDLLRKQRELDDAKREIEITIEKRLQEGLHAVRNTTRKEVEDQLNLKVKEKEETISSMQKQIEDLRRKADQGSQQLQGEVMELELETLLKSKFPYDIISPVPKGEHGGDILQYVTNSLGQKCGTILWETKRTKNWTDSWLPKLREDQRTAKAEIAVILSQTLPKNVDEFELIDTIWVANPRVTFPVAMILRQSLIEVAAARQSNEGQNTKMEMVYRYLTGPRFRLRVQAIVEAFNSMKEDLDREKKLLTKQWAKRDEQIHRVMENTLGMYGDLQGIAGRSLQEIEGLELPTLDAPIQDSLLP